MAISVKILSNVSTLSVADIISEFVSLTNSNCKLNIGNKYIYISMYIFVKNGFICRRGFQNYHYHQYPINSDISVAEEVFICCLTDSTIHKKNLWKIFS